MRDQNDRTSQRPSDVRSISDPPDMGRLKPAEEVAREMVERFDDPAHGRPYSSFILDNWCEKGTDLCLEECITKERRDAIANKAETLLANLIRQSRAEGAAAALEEVADAFEMAADENGEVAGAESLDGYHDRAKSLATKSEAFRSVSTILRARAKGISDPPDMG